MRAGRGTDQMTAQRPELSEDGEGRFRRCLVTWLINIQCYKKPRLQPEVLMCGATLVFVCLKTTEL